MEDQSSSTYCNDCQMTCNSLTTFKNHVRKRHPTKFQQLFSSKSDSTSKYRCDDCRQCFTSNRLLSGHRKTMHSERDKSMEVQRTNSIRRSAIEDESIECSDCEIEFNDLVTFKQHMRDHRDNKIVKVKKKKAHSPRDQSNSSGKKIKRKNSEDKAVKSEKLNSNVNILDNSENGDTPVRKSTRVRKQISYAKLVMSSSDSENETLASKVDVWRKSGKNHVCKECHMEYLNQNDLLKHTRKHHPSKLTKKNDKPITTWKKIKLSDKKHTCEDCKTTYNNLSCLRKHIRKYHPIKWTELASALHKRKRKNAENTYNCSECQTVYRNVMGYRKHVRKYHPLKFSEMAGKLYKKTPKNIGKVLSCPECEVKYCFMQSLRKHIMKEHPTNISELISKINDKEFEKTARLIPCTECDVKYSNMSALRKHTRKHHPNKLLELAPKLYTFKRNLAKNILLKDLNGEFKGDENLLNGELVNMYKYMCSVCQSSYSNISNLRKHLRKFHPAILSDVAPLQKDHTNFKYLCDLCPKKFNCLRNFNYHQRKCHPEFAQPCRQTQKHIKVNKCPLCNFENTERKKLLDHFKDEHDIEVSMSPVDVHSVEQFSKWKDSFEKETNARFVKEYHFSCSSHDVVSYICHRSGYYNPKGKGLRHMKAQGSSKINGYCPAAIKLKKIKDGTVKVTFCGTHIGHTTDVNHLHLTPAERQVIAEKIAMNMPFKDILESMKDSVSDTKRIHMLSKKDLYNIKSSFNLSSPEVKPPKPPADNVTFEKWIEDMKKNDDCIMFHKQQGGTLEEYPELRSEDFVLMIMNQMQRDKLRKFGHETVCIDRSLDLNCHHFELVSMLVLNENKEGFPCAFLITNRSDQEVMTLFFNFIKANVGCVEAKVFMSDMVDHFYSAWISVMSDVQLRFYCTWLIEHAWRKKVVLIKSKEKQETVMNQLKAIIDEMNLPNLRATLENVVTQLSSETFAWNFANYLNENYLQREELWPGPDCVFTDVKLDANFERMHRTLNHLFLNGKNAKHFGKALGDVMRFVREKMFDRTILINRGKINNKMKIAIFRHKLSLHSKTDTITKIDDGWQIPSTETSEIYTIREAPVMCRCEFICPECKCCVHKYLCSCLDSYVKWNMCKHIHLLCRYLNSVEGKAREGEREQSYVKEPAQQQILFVKGPRMEYVKQQQVEYIKQPLQIEYVEQTAQDHFEVMKQAQKVEFVGQTTQIEGLQMHHIQMDSQVGHDNQVESTYIYCNETNQREMDAILAEVNICNLETVQVTQIPTSCTIQIPTSCTVVPQVSQISAESFGAVVDTKESLKMKFLKLLEEASSPSELEVVQKMLASITPTLEVIKETTSNHQVLSVIGHDF